MKKNVLNFIGASIITSLMPLTSNAQAGAALNFDGANDGIVLPSTISTSLAGGNALTIETWIKPTNTSVVRKLVCNHSPSSSQFVLSILPGGAIEFFITPGGTYAIITPAGTATLNVWQHIAAVFNGNSCKVYVNGMLSAGSATFATIGILTSAQSPSIAADGYLEYFQGDMDEVRIWNTARTQCQINTYMNCEIPTTGTGLMANYHFNQGVAAAANPTVTTLIDASGNAYTGSLSSMALTGATSNWITPGAVVSGFTTTLASPTLSVTSSQSTAACPGTTANLTASGGSNFVWVAPLTSTVAVATITLQVPSPTYSVNGTAPNGCVGTGTFMQLVTANPATIASSPVSSLMCTGESKTLTAAAGASTYAWQAPLTSTTAVAVISPTAAGNFSYTVLSTGSVCPGYTWTSVFTQSVSTCVGIQNATAQNVSFGVYPNPTLGEFTIELNNGTTKTVEVIDLTGKIILTNTSSSDKITINLSNLAKGIYYVRVQSNNTIEYAKLIKE